MVRAEQHAYEELLEAALVDVRVYRKCHGVSDPHLVASRGRPRRLSASTSLSLTRCSDRERQRRCLVEVFHDCERIFLSAYDPATSFRWQSVIEENDVDALLAPNSIERADTIRTPPATRQEMYDRLVQLCLLEPRDNNTKNKTSHALSSDSSALFPPPSLRLVLRPSAVRLYRRVIRLSGRFVTVTMAELSRGRIQVDAFLHDASLELRRIVSLESILERLSHQDAKNAFVAPERLPAMVLDRLRLYRLQQSAAHHRSNASTSTRLGVVTRESAPGRVLLRRAIRSPWLCRPTNSSQRSVPALWMLTV
ncbi:hypothetical protein PINS_up015617 [Pythium insidiosum]|nr:hypothetical protein PINS_up015617 [Pythium insidiosum]